jgi:predicted ATP-dependent endonuclease of OLD family
MKLTKVQITNFRSIEDTGEFKINNVTSLVGKNEAGKSAILQALATLNPHSATPLSLDRERDYPRRFLTQYSQRHPKDEAIVVTTTWQLDEDDTSEIEMDFGKGALSSKEVVIIRRYGSKVPEWKLNIDFAKAIKNLFQTFGLDSTESSALKAATTSTELIKELEALSTPTENQKALLAKLKSYGSITARITQILGATLPFFMYFSNYDRMEGAIQIEQINQLNAEQLKQEAYKGQRLFKEFFEYAGVPLNEILKVNTYETFNAKLQAASNNITDQILEYWTQNPDLRVNVRIEQSKSGDHPPLNTGTIAWARIYNDLHRVDTPFSERSAGFVWFFSFLVKFAQVKNEKVPVILLLDEPGLSLHGKAQGDLLRYFDEKLAPHHQVIYSTHSPFMVAADRLTSARIVEDQVETRGPRRIPMGTKVREDVLGRDPDTLFPLQGALGYEITQSLFIGKHTLLVEGPSDILYLQAFSSALSNAQSAGLDTRWTLCPSGGIGNIRSFMALFAGNKIDVAVLADYVAGQKNQIQSLRASDILKSGRVLTIHTFTGKSESDIEDLFEPELFAELLNSAYSLTGAHAVNAQSLENADSSTPRLVKKAEAYFRTGVPSSVTTFDHFRPAEWLIQNPSFLRRDLPEVKNTLARAELLICELNKLLV